MSSFLSSLNKLSDNFFLNLSNDQLFLRIHSPSQADIDLQMAHCLMMALKRGEIDFVKLLLENEVSPLKV